MEKVCAWCGKGLGTVAGAPGTEHRITHAICDRCRDRLGARIGIPLREFLESLAAPVMLVDAHSRAVAGNSALGSIAGVAPERMPGRFPGDVFECAHVRAPGGCGFAIHCSGCVIRNSVEETMSTGNAVTRVPATLDHGTDDPYAGVRFLISTEKVGDRVLLRVDPAD